MANLFTLLNPGRNIGLPLVVLSQDIRLLIPCTYLRMMKHCPNSSSQDNIPFICGLQQGKKHVLILFPGNVATTQKMHKAILDNIFTDLAPFSLDISL